jgi:enoyl-CoA hydratase
MQTLWALNGAILKARMDEATEAVLIAHEGARLQLGIASSVDDYACRYADFVFSRLENYPRLCVMHLSGSADVLGSELALACDYRLGPQRKNTSETLLSLPPSCNRYARYLPPHTAVPAKTMQISCSQAVEQGLFKLLGDDASLRASLSWMARFVPPRGASKALGYAKLAIVKSATLQHEAGALLERHLQEQLFRGHDGPEGMRAYLEKRSAAFKGN